MQRPGGYHVQENVTYRRPPFQGRCNCRWLPNPCGCQIQAAATSRKMPRPGKCHVQEDAKVHEDVMSTKLDMPVTSRRLPRPGKCHVQENATNKNKKNVLLKWHFSGHNSHLDVTSARTWQPRRRRFNVTYAADCNKIKNQPTPATKVRACVCLCTCVLGGCCKQETASILLLGL